MRFGSFFCYDHDYEDCGPSDWDLARSWYYSSFSEQEEEDEDEVDFSLHDALSVPVVRDWDYYESGRGRLRSKAATLRSWRNPRALGGSQSRKAVVRKMNQRLSLKLATPAPSNGFSGLCPAS